MGSRREDALTLIMGALMGASRDDSVERVFRLWLELSREEEIPLGAGEGRAWPSRYGAAQRRQRPTPAKLRRSGGALLQVTSASSRIASQDPQRATPSTIIDRKLKKESAIRENAATKDVHPMPAMMKDEAKTLRELVRKYGLPKRKEADADSDKEGESRDLVTPPYGVVHPRSSDTRHVGRPGSGELIARRLTERHVLLSRTARTAAQILQHERRKQWRQQQVEAERRLTTLFQTLNDKLFDGQLPPHVVRQVPAHILGLAAGRYHRNSQTILISEKRSQPEQEEVLKHEMCHVRGRFHGVRFRAELARLAERGDPWAAQELAELEPTEDNIRGWIHELTDRNPLLTWIAGRTEIADMFGLPVRELLRRAPWAREEWHRLRTPSRPLRSPAPPPFPHYSDDPWHNQQLRDHFSFLDD